MDSGLGLANLFRWSAQAALLACVGAVLLRLFRIDAPVLRHAFWRVLLIICLILPLLQPWERIAPTFVPIPEVGAVPVVAQDVAPRGITRGPSAAAAFTTYVRANWVTVVTLLLAAGVAARVAWVAAGLFRLHRLRRRSTPAIPDDHDDLSVLIEAGASIEYVPGLGQPVTFGLFRPVVLLPDRFSSLPAGVQRAVLAHELWHVRRCDWAFVLIEEMIRALFWFSPAVWWLVTQVQTSREEVVDELTVQLTNSRRTYLEALLVFADQPTVFPATPFARRRHLFHRMLLISREAVMSSRRIVSSSIAVGVAIVAAGWAAASAFPLVASTPPEPEPQAQNPPRDRRPGEAGPESQWELQLKEKIRTDPSNSESYFALAGLQLTRGATSDAEATLDAIERAFSTDVKVLAKLARLHQSGGRFDKAVSVLERLAVLQPGPQAYQLIAVFYWEKASKDRALSAAEATSYIRSGLAATDRALAYDPDFVEGLIYKNLLLRMQANLESDQGTRSALIAEADTLRNRATELARARGAAFGGVPGGVAGGVPGGVAVGPPPPPPPPAEFELVNGVRPVRIGGELKPPRKIRHVNAVYPPIAQAARVQGVIILEALIDVSGQVINARVLRGQPLLDQAAMDAVMQWQFEPTLLNGAPVPLIMTMTVNFVLDP